MKNQKKIFSGITVFITMVILFVLNACQNAAGGDTKNNTEKEKNFAITIKCPNELVGKKRDRLDAVPVPKLAPHCRSPFPIRPAPCPVPPRRAQNGHRLAFSAIFCEETRIKDTTEPGAGPESDAAPSPRGRKVRAK